MEALVSSNDVLFVLLGAIMVLAMHAGFAFLEVGTVRKKKSSECLSENYGRFFSFNYRLFFYWLQYCLWD